MKGKDVVMNIHLPIVYTNEGQFGGNRKSERECAYVFFGYIQ